MPVVTFDLPDDVAKEAKEMGLLEPEEATAIIRRALETLRNGGTIDQSIGESDDNES